MPPVRRDLPHPQGPSPTCARGTCAPSGGASTWPRTKGFVDRKKLVLHVLEKHPGTELASSFRTEGFTKVKGQHKLKKLKKKPEPGAAARKKTKKADTTKKTNKPTRKKSTSAAATPTMRRTPTPRREEEPVTWAHNLFGSPRAAAKAARTPAPAPTPTPTPTPTRAARAARARATTTVWARTATRTSRGRRIEGENGDDGRPGVLDDGDAWETVKPEPEDDAIEISTDEEPRRPWSPGWSPCSPWTRATRGEAKAPESAEPQEDEGAGEEGARV